MQDEHITIANLPPELPAMPPVTMVDGKGDVSVVSQHSRRIVLHTRIDSAEATVVLKLFYSPGWLADIPGVTIAPLHALLALKIPRGTHDITLILPWFAGECEGLFITLTAAGVLLGMTIASRRLHALP
jgi:hypothetical protein